MSQAQPAADPRAAEIVKVGKLRVGLFPSFFYSRTATGDFSGWGIEMARALGQRLGVELQLVERPSPPAIVDCLKAGDCDVAFLGIAPERAAIVDFTQPWVQAEFTFLVPAGSSIMRIPDADTAGMRVGVVRNHAMDTALRGKLNRAEAVYADTPDAAFALLQKGEVGVLAGIRPGLISYATKAPGACVLPDRYGANVIGLAVAKGRSDWLAYLSAFVAETKSSGSAKAATERAGADGLEVVP